MVLKDGRATEAGLHFLALRSSVPGKEQAGAAQRLRRAVHRSTAPFTTQEAATRGRAQSCGLSYDVHSSFLGGGPHRSLQAPPVAGRADWAFPGSLGSELQPAGPSVTQGSREPPSRGSTGSFLARPRGGCSWWVAEPPPG